MRDLIGVEPPRDDFQLPKEDVKTWEEQIGP